MTSDNQFAALNPQFPTNLISTYTQPLFRNRTIDANRRNILIAGRNVNISDSQLRQEAITDQPAPANGGPAPAKAPDARLFLLIGAAVAAVLLLVGGVVGGGLWWMLSGRDKAPPTRIV